MERRPRFMFFSPPRTLATNEGGLPSKAHSAPDVLTLARLGQPILPIHRRCSSDSASLVRMPLQHDRHADSSLTNDSRLLDDSRATSRYTPKSNANSVDHSELDLSGLPIGRCPRPLDSGLARILDSSSTASDLPDTSSDLFVSPIPRLRWFPSRGSGRSTTTPQDSPDARGSPLRSTPIRGDMTSLSWNTSREHTRQFTFGVAPSWNGESSQDIFSSSPPRTPRRPRASAAAVGGEAEHIPEATDDALGVTNDATSDLEFEAISELEASREVFDMFHLQDDSFIEGAAESSILEREQSFVQSFLRMDDDDDTDDAASEASDEEDAERPPEDTRAILEQLFPDAEGAANPSGLAPRQRLNSFSSARSDVSPVLSAMPSSASLYAGPPPWLKEEHEGALMDDGLPGAAAPERTADAHEENTEEVMGDNRASRPTIVVHGVQAETPPSSLNSDGAASTKEGDAVDPCRSDHVTDSIQTGPPHLSGEPTIASTSPRSTALSDGVVDVQAQNIIAKQSPGPLHATPPATVSELDEDLQFILACRLIASQSAVPPPVPARHPARPNSGTLGRSAVSQGHSAPSHHHTPDMHSSSGREAPTPRRAWSTTMPHRPQSLERRPVDALFASDPYAVERARAVSAPVGWDGRPLRPLPSRNLLKAATLGHAHARSAALMASNAASVVPLTVDDQITLALLQHSDADYRASVRSSVGPNRSRLSHTQRSEVGTVRFKASTIRTRSIASPIPQGRVTSFVEGMTMEDLGYAPTVRVSMCGMRTRRLPRGCGPLTVGPIHIEQRTRKWKRFWSVVRGREA